MLGASDLSNTVLVIWPIEKKQIGKHEKQVASVQGMSNFVVTDKWRH